MSKSEKLIERFKKVPNDFTFDEAAKLLSYFGYELYNKGKTSGSRVIFYRKSDKKKILLHRPHDPTVMKRYAVSQLLATLIDYGDIKENEKYE